MNATRRRLTGPALAAQLTIRIAFLPQLILGILQWTGRFDQLRAFHVLLGVVIVVALLVLTVLGARGGAGPALVVIAALLCLALPVLGLTQESLVAGGSHWIIQVLHLAIGVAAIGVAEAIAMRLAAARVPVSTTP